jgi:hypothetical protein
MAEEPENLTLKLLRELRAEMREGFEKAFGELAALRGSMSELQIAVAATRADVGIIKQDVEKIGEIQANQGARLNAIDGRLGIIENAHAERKFEESSQGIDINKSRRHGFPIHPAKATQSRNIADRNHKDCERKCERQF